MKLLLWFGLTLFLLCSVYALAEAPPSCEASGSPLDAEVETFPAEAWVWAETPEALGWSSEKLAMARAYADRIGSAAVMIVDGGVVVDAWGDTTRNYLCHSMRKSLFSALFGLYVAEGVIDLSQTLGQLGIGDVTPLTETEKQATVADLLKARSGVYIPAAGESQSMIDARPERGSHEPGTFWYYNNWDFNALGTIFTWKMGGESIFEAFQERIADPIGMEDFRPEELEYVYEPYSAHPYYGFTMSARDLARFGLLFLRGGRWEGEEVIPSDWVEESTTSYSETGPNGGYGYMWWTGRDGGLFPNVTVGGHSYYASGYRGHRVVVLPYRDLVVVHRVDTFQPEGEVSEEQFGVLLWLILDAAGETEIGDPVLIDRATGVRLGGEELRAMMPGRTLQWMNDGVEISMLSDPSGELVISVDGVPVITGTWSIEDAVYCVDLPGTDLGGCYHAVLNGDEIGFYELDGFLSKRFTLASE